MFVTDICKNFFNEIVGKRIAVFVGFDVDALCACKILQYLLQCDHIVYSLIPVSGIRDLESAFQEHVDQVKHFVLVNCGANVNLIDLLQPEDDVRFYVADSHRPVDIFNVYNANQVILLMPMTDGSGEDIDFPPLESIYCDDDLDEGVDDNTNDDFDEELDGDGEVYSDERTRKRRRLNEIIERRIARKKWEKERDRILFEYNQFSYYGPSVTAVLLFEMAWKMSKDNNDILWWAAIGLTESLVNHKIEQSDYILQAGKLQAHVSRLNYKVDNGEDNISSVHNLKISFDKELQLALYRHWSLYHSFKYTAYTACQFQLWTLKGKKKLCEFLAEIGLPLVQCKQHFSSMDMYLRNNVKSWIEMKNEKYRLQQIINGSFVAQFGYKNKFCAADFVYATSALLEATDASRTLKDNLLDALACLSRQNLEVIDRGIDVAKRQMAAIFQQVQTFLDLNLVISAGPFLYAVVTEGAPGSLYFKHPICLLNLAHCLLRAHVTLSKNRKSRSLPLVLVSPSGDGGADNNGIVESSYQLVAGIPPLSEEFPKNFFGQAFLQAATSLTANTIHDQFDSFIFQIPLESNSSFFDSLTSILN